MTHPHTEGFRIQPGKPRLQVGLEMELGRIMQPFRIQGRSDLCLFSREPKIILNQNLRAIKEKKIAAAAAVTTQLEETGLSLDLGLGVVSVLTALWASLSE